MGGCNSVHIKPGTLEPGAKVYAAPGGYGIRRAVKPLLEDRGYVVSVGKNHTYSGNDEIEVDKYEVPNDIKYSVRVSEKKEMFSPVWCFFNGFWWWRFNVSISDRETGQEIMAWRGRGCANSSMRKFNRYLDKLEKKY